MSEKNLDAGLLGVAADTELLESENLMPHIKERIKHEIKWQEWVKSFPCDGNVITIDRRKWGRNAQEEKQPSTVDIKKQTKSDCEWGCGRPGLFWKAHSKKWCCSEMAYHCPSFKTNQGMRVSAGWKSNKK